MRYWLCGSTAVLLAAMLAAAAPRVEETGGKKRQNELTLAGLRPGRDKLRAATNRFGPYYQQVVAGEDGELVWVDTVKRRVLRLELDKGGVIQSVTVSAIDPITDKEPADPKKSMSVALPSPQVATGRGIRIAHSVRGDVIEAYGEPNSAGPATQHGQELELLYYSFDWAGPKVPQVMQVSCELGTRRVVQITLAFPGL